MTTSVLRITGNSPGILYGIDQYGQRWITFSYRWNGKPYYAVVCDRCGKRTQHGWRALNRYGGVRSCPDHISLLRNIETEIS